MSQIARFRAFVLDGHMGALEDVIAEIYTALVRPSTGFALLDGGAHKGFHTKRMQRLPGCRRVYAVEADPFMADRLAAELAALPPEGRAETVLVRKALQDDPACTDIAWRSSHSHVGRSSIVSRSAEGPQTIWQDAAEMEYREAMRVPATTIDTLLADEPGPVPFLKLDLEGADLLALRGASQTLRDRRPVVAFENSVRAAEVHGYTLPEMIAYFEGLDYVPMDFAGTPMTERTWFGLFEAFAVPRDRAEWLGQQLRRATAARLDA